MRRIIGVVLGLAVILAMGLVGAIEPRWTVEDASGNAVIWGNQSGDFNFTGDLLCTSCINPEDVNDIDDADVEGDLNTYVDIPGDTMTGPLIIDTGEVTIIGTDGSGADAPDVLNVTGGTGGAGGAGSDGYNGSDILLTSGDGGTGGAGGLGSEELADPGFDDAGEWTGTGWTILGSVAQKSIYIGTDTLSEVNPFTVKSSTQYKVVLVIGSVIGVWSVYVTLGGDTGTTYTTAGTKTFYLDTINTNSLGIVGTCNDMAGFNLNSISIKEVFPGKTGGAGGDINLTPGTGGAGGNGGSAGSGGYIIMNNLPTSDPSVAGAVWNDSGTLKISGG